MKKEMKVLRIVGEENISLAINFTGFFDKEKTEKKALLFDLTTLNGFGSNLNFTRDRGAVFFSFSREKLTADYYSWERDRYINMLSELQRFGQSRGIVVDIQSTINY